MNQEEQDKQFAEQQQQQEQQRAEKNKRKHESIIELLRQEESMYVSDDDSDSADDETQQRGVHVIVQPKAEPSTTHVGPDARVLYQALKVLAADSKKREVGDNNNGHVDDILDIQVALVNSLHDIGLAQQNEIALAEGLKRSSSSSSTVANNDQFLLSSIDLHDENYAEPDDQPDDEPYTPNTSEDDEEE